MDKSILISTFQAFVKHIDDNTNEEFKLKSLKDKLDKIKDKEKDSKELREYQHIEKINLLKQIHQLETLLTTKKTQSVELLNHTMQVITRPLDTGTKQSNDAQFLTDKLFDIANKK